jgi:hypothetical protein
LHKQQCDVVATLTPPVLAQVLAPALPALSPVIGIYTIFSSKQSFLSSASS